MRALTSIDSSTPQRPAGTVRLEADGPGGQRVGVELSTLPGPAGSAPVVDLAGGARVSRPRRRRDARRTGGQRDYEAAGQGRNNAGWWAPNTAANVEVRKSLTILRSRSRDLIRNNGTAANIIEKLTANLIGDGIRPRANTGDRNLDKRVNDLWSEWVKVADPFHGLDFYGVQDLACRAWLESGEVMIRKRIRRLDDGLPVPLQLEVLESDLLDPFRLAELPNGGRVVAGVEFDPLGRRSGYWILPFHPGDQLVGSNLLVIPGWTSRFVSAGDMIHLYRPTRPGQVRGVPWLSPVAQDIRDLDDYGYAERVRKRIEACMVAFVMGNTPSDVLPDADGISPSVEDANGDPIEEFSPGMIALVRDGKTITVSAPNASPDYPGYMKAERLEIAAGAGVTYEQATGDLSGVSFASYRVGRVEFFRAMRKIHKLIMIPKVCAPVWGWFTELAQASGALPLRKGGYPCRWSEPRFESIERDKDAGADKLEMRNGTRDGFDIIASYGRDPVEVLEQAKEFYALLDELGLVFDTDPRKVAAPGAGGMGGAGADPPADEKPKVDDTGTDGGEPVPAAKADTTATAAGDGA